MKKKSKYYFKIFLAILVAGALIFGGFRLVSNASKNLTNPIVVEEEPVSAEDKAEIEKGFKSVENAKPTVVQTGVEIRESSVMKKYTFDPEKIKWIQYVSTDGSSNVLSVPEGQAPPAGYVKK